MDNQNKTKEELLQELKKLQQENDDLRKSHIKGIAENKLAEESLTESEEKFRSVFESNMLGTFFWDANGDIIEANDAFLDFMGYSREELSVGLLKWNELTPTKYEKIDEGKLKELTERGKIDPYEKEYIHKNGQLIPIIISAATLSGSKTIGVATIIDITERKQMEDKLTLERKRFKQILDNFPFGIYIIDNKYNIEYSNSILTQEFGIPGTRKCYEYFHDFTEPCSWCQNLKVIKGETVYWEWNSPKNNRDYELVDIPLHNADGSISKLEVFHDITERKQAEQKIAISLEREQFLGDLVRHASVAIGVGYPDGSLGLCNLAFQKLTGYSEKELKNIAWNSVLTPQEWLESEMQSLAELNHTKQSIIYQKEYIHKNGNRIPIELVVHPICDINGDITTYFAFITDITERKQKEVELILAKEKAEESDKLKTAFLCNMSHEIRTPMNGILGFSSLLSEPGLESEKQQAYIKIIQKSGARMLNILSEIVEISKIESGTIEMNIKKVNINKNMESVYNLFKPEAEFKSLKISFKNSFQVTEPIIQIDGEKFYGILSILVNNAIKYTDKGSIEFGYNYIEINGINFLQFYVKDTGIGIHKDRQEAIFERFIQADIIDVEARQGAGLGLAIVKSYVEMLGGEVWVDSEKGIGSTFYFTLPYNAEPKEKIIVQNGLPPDKADIQVDSKYLGLKILIVEDDETSRIYLSTIIKGISTKVFFASSGIKAVTICQSNPDINLVLMDIQMPEMNGYEATQEIRKFNKGIIIAAQTSFAMPGDREKAIDAGCNDYISKPINKDELLSLIQKYFKK